MGSPYEIEHGIKVLKRHGKNVAVCLDPGAFTNSALKEIVTDQVFSQDSQITIVGKDVTEPLITAGDLRELRHLSTWERKEEIDEIVYRMRPALEVVIESIATSPSKQPQRPPFSKDFFAEFVNTLDIDDFKRDTVPGDDFKLPLGFETTEEVINSISSLDDFKGPQGK